MPAVSAAAIKSATVMSTTVKPAMTVMAMMMSASAIRAGSDIGRVCAGAADETGIALLILAFPFRGKDEHRKSANTYSNERSDVIPVHGR